METPLELAEVGVGEIGESSQFYGPPGKLEPEDLIKRYEKLYAPYGGGTLGRVVRERFTWTLGAIPDQKQGSKLVKSARKLEGVSAVELDADTLTVEVYLADLSACLPGGTLLRARSGPGTVVSPSQRVWVKVGNAVTFPS